MILYPLSKSTRAQSRKTIPSPAYSSDLSCHFPFHSRCVWRTKLLYVSVHQCTIHYTSICTYVRTFIVSYHNCCKWRHTIDTCGNNSFYLCKIRRRWLGLAQNLFEFYNLNNIVLWVAKLIFHLLRKTNLIFKYRMTKF